MNLMANTTPKKKRAQKDRNRDNNVRSCKKGLTVERNPTTTKKQINKKQSNTKTLYIHWQYHPFDITKNAIRKTYNITLMGIDGFVEITVCFSRPRNLRDPLAESMLQGKHSDEVYM
jgi:hypothetical protein